MLSLVQSLKPSREYFRQGFLFHNNENSYTGMWSDDMINHQGFKISFCVQSPLNHIFHEKKMLIVTVINIPVNARFNRTYTHKIFWENIKNHIKTSYRH